MPKSSNTMAQARRIVRAKGFDSLAEACRKSDFPLSSMNHVLREGLGRNPRARTVEVLTHLGLIELARAAR